MGQQANIAVFDGATVPVVHNLVGEGVSTMPDGTISARWKESLPTVPDYAQVRLVQTKRKLPSGIFRVSSRCEVPVMESISGVNSSGYTAAPKVAFTDTTEIVGYYHERSVVNGRRLSRQMALNVAGGVTTTVTPVTVGPAPELFDQLVIVT